MTFTCMAHNSLHIIIIVISAQNPSFHLYGTFKFSYQCICFGTGHRKLACLRFSWKGAPSTKEHRIGTTVPILKPSNLFKPTVFVHESKLHCHMHGVLQVALLKGLVLHLVSKYL